jgi:hypothetical protein
MKIPAQISLLFGTKLHEFLGLSSPLNPLITVINHALAQNSIMTTKDKPSLDLQYFIKRSLRAIKIW